MPRKPKPTTNEVRAAADRAERQKHPGGRPSIYTTELADEFCRRVAEGRSTLSVYRDDDMPEGSTIYKWRAERPEFSEKLARAREERLEAYAHRIDEIGRRVMAESDLDPQRANAAVNAIDKAARLQMPKQRVELTGKDGGPIATKSEDAVAALLSAASPDERAALRGLVTRMLEGGEG